MQTANRFVKTQYNSVLNSRETSEKPFRAAVLNIYVTSVDLVNIKV